MKLDEPLARLEHTELIRRIHNPDAAYLFKHALVQDTAYASLLKHERKRLHRLIGETIEALYPDALQDNAALLVKHFAEAGDDAKILEYGTRAGNVEARIFAKPEAIAHYDAAFQAAVRMHAPVVTISELAAKLGRMYELNANYEGALETYARLMELSQARGDARLELAALMLQATVRATPTPVFEPRIGQEICDRALVLARALNDGAAEAKILWNLLLLNGFLGQPQQAIAYGEQSLALARRLNLTEQIAYTLSDIGIYGYFANAEADKSRAVLSEARGMWRAQNNLPMLGDNLNNSGILEFIWGDFAQAQIYYQEALSVSERIGNAWGQSLARGFKGLHHAEAGEFGSALSDMQTAYALVQHAGSGITLIAATNLSLMYTMVGETVLAYDIIQIAKHDIEIPLYRAPAKSALAYASFLRGDMARAHAFLREAHPSKTLDLEFTFLPGIIAHGEIELADGHPEQVIAYMTALVEILQNFGIGNFVADAEMYRGRALFQLARFAEATAAFARAYEFAARLHSQRALLHIYTHWARAERAQNNFARADDLSAQARAIRERIAATLPETWRAAFNQIHRDAERQ